MRSRKFLGFLLTAGLMTGLLTGCGSKEAVNEEIKSTAEVAESSVESNTESSEGSKEAITFMTNVVAGKAEALEAAVKAFEAETGYTVEFSAPGADYEELLKVKMGANELPDVFTTHGWSVARYSDYLKPVNEMSFFDKIDPQILPAITAKDGSVYVLPVDVDIAGITYNVDVVTAAGVDVDSIKTWEDFGAACATIKSKGYEPIHMGGKDSWTIGQYFDWAAPSFYVTDETNSKSEELKTGTFDEKVWEQISQMMADWKEAGYFNEDVLTADYTADIEALAKGEAAFAFYGNSAANDVAAVNAETKIGMMPIPSNNKGDEVSLITGEDIAVGIWKDTKNSKAAEELLDYLARPEVMADIAAAAGNKPGLTGVETNMGPIQEYVDKYSSVETFPYFDREYLPSGLWDTMCLTGAEILAGTDGAVQSAGAEMKEVFEAKYSAE